MLKKDFFLREDVCQIARDLLGKTLITSIDNKIAAGIITETEAYAGIQDRASHSFGGRRTKRNEIMYAEGGHIYVYLCYGLHHLFNIVTNNSEIPQAVLIRAIFPLKGQNIMTERRKKKNYDKKIGIGPGNVSSCLGISIKDNGLRLTKNRIWVEDNGITIPENRIISGPRIGVDYAGEDAKLPYRFLITNLD